LIFGVVKRKDCAGAFAWPLGSVPGEIIYGLFTNYQWLLGHYRTIEAQQLLMSFGTDSGTSIPKGRKYGQASIRCFPFNFTNFQPQTVLLLLCHDCSLVHVFDSLFTHAIRHGGYLTLVREAGGVEPGISHERGPPQRMLLKFPRN
jgi:hypothetical protein